ncbi:MAG: hypothetical protein JSS83_14560 [Cyanobacteria bacterium SZAS LIN-3]|nr:hypothetical protein [Cyanobacteria bacterium SZAS LIN-3]
MKCSNTDGHIRARVFPFSICLVLTLLNAGRVDGSPNKPPAIQKASDSSAPKSKSLSPSEQQKFLETRLPGAMIGSFGAFSSLLYAVDNTIIGTDDKDVLKAEVRTMYPPKEVYMPTHAELFDMIARQTGSSFSYEPKRNYWHFRVPPMPLPYTITKAPGWIEENRGDYVAYIPSIAPVGMDIYMMGKYSALSPAQEKEIREFGAKMFSRHIAPKATVNDMKFVTVDGTSALYFAAPAPQGDRLWRQWAFLKGGELYVIVSCYGKDQKEQIERDVDLMVSTFHGNDAAPKKF